MVSIGDIGGLDGNSLSPTYMHIMCLLNASPTGASISWATQKGTALLRATPELCEAKVRGVITISEALRLRLDNSAVRRLESVHLAHDIQSFHAARTVRK